jgi:hypothetical protein
LIVDGTDNGDGEDTIPTELEDGVESFQMVDGWWTRKSKRCVGDTFIPEGGTRLVDEVSQKVLCVSGYLFSASGQRIMRANREDDIQTHENSAGIRESRLREFEDFVHNFGFDAEIMGGSPIAGCAMTYGGLNWTDGGRFAWRSQ